MGTVLEQMLAKHKDLIELLMKRGKYELWVKKRNAVKQDDVELIEKSDLLQIENDYKIKFPEDIVYFYTEIGSKVSDFHYQIRRMKSDTNQSMIEYYYSETLAYAIVEAYMKLSDFEKKKLTKEIEITDKNNLRKDYGSDLEYLLWEGCGFYNQKDNFFSFPFLQSVFEKMGADSNLMIEYFQTWIHCGGSGGIILNSNMAGFNGGMMWGCGLEVEYEGVSYEYYSNNRMKQEKHHLSDHLPSIEKNLNDLKDFVSENIY